MSGARGGRGIRLYTRILSAFIIPFLVAASAILYIVPSRTEELFAWKISSTLSAMLLGSAYLGGIWFFVRVLGSRSWARVKHGFPAVFVFASLAAIATLLHWDRFTHGHISFVTWVVLYLTTPFLVLAAIILNRHDDDGVATAGDYFIPTGVRIALAVLGLAALVTGLALFVNPGWLIDTWAWPLTPLTSRILGAMFTLPGMVNVWMLRDSRWSAFRVVVEAEIFSLAFITAALAFANGELDWTRPATPLVVGGLALSLVSFLAFYLWCERKAARNAA